MIESIRMNIWGLLLSAALTLSATSFVCAQDVEKKTSLTTPPTVKVFQLRPDDVTAMIASSGSLAGKAKAHARSANVVAGFNTPQDTVTWTVSHSLAVDPSFVDPSNGDFRLKPDSPALNLGIVPLDMSKVGLQSDKK